MVPFPEPRIPLMNIIFLFIKLSTPAEFKIESVKFFSGNYLQFVDKKFSILYIMDFK